MSDTRTALLDAAEDLVRRRGPDGFSYSDLAKAVDIRKASIHYHFPYKHDLLAALVVRYRERMEAALAAIEARAEPASAHLAAYVGIYRAALKDGHSICLCVALGIASETLAELAMDELKRFHDMSTDWLERLHALALADATVAVPDDAGAWALQVMATMEGAQISARITGPATFDRIAGALLL